MIALNILDIKQFALKLFVEEVFDHFLLKEASITTFNTFSIDGNIWQEYYSQEELEEKKIGTLSVWSAVRPFCFSLIKGKKLPTRFRIVLQMPPEKTKEFLESCSIPFSSGEVRNLYLNIRYEENRLTCITGTWASVFTLDKTMEEQWDQEVRGFLKQQEIPCS